MDFKTALIFGLPAIVSVSLVRSFLIPIIPDELFVFNLPSGSEFLAIFQADELNDV